MAKKKEHALSELLRVPRGERVDLASYDSGATPGDPRDKRAGPADMARMGTRLADLQERLWAASTAGDRRTAKHVIGLLNPAGCRIKAFKAPTAEERRHPFLWRVRRALPTPASWASSTARSPIEDVLIAPVRGLTPTTEPGRRYGRINRFEQSLAEDGVTVIKCFLHISYEEQRTRLLKRLDRPDKHWRFNIGDIDERELWPAHVIPADRKWYRNRAVSRLLLEHLEALDPRYPKPDFDVAEARVRLLKGA